MITGSVQSLTVLCLCYSFPVSVVELYIQWRELQCRIMTSPCFSPNT